MESRAARRGLTMAIGTAFGLVAAAPAFGAEPEVEALKQEVAAQRKLIDDLMAKQNAAQASPSSAQDVQQKLGEQGKQPLTAPAATPPAPSSTQFKVYGLADVAATYTSTGFGRKARLEGGGGMRASRLGMQITRQVNEKIKATAVFEAGVQIDSGSTGGSTPVLGINNTAASSGGAPGTGPQIFARQAWAGLDAGFGQVSIGRQYTGSYIAVAVVGSAFGDGLYGNTGNFTPLIGGMPTRVNNSIVWATPKFGGLYGVVTYTTGAENNVSSPTAVGTTTTTDAAGRGYDLAAVFARGPVQASLTTWEVNNNAWVTAGETGLAKKKGYQIAANYDFGVAKVFGDFVHGTISGGGYENFTKTLSSATGWGASVLVPIGQHNVVVTYTDFNDKSLQNKDAKLFGLSYWYALTPETNLYASVGRMKNNANASYVLNDTGNIVGTVANPGANASGAMVGLSYRF